MRAWNLTVRNSLLILAIGLIFSRVQGFPPAPDHILYGTVRDELGNPLQMDNAEVLMETSSGMRLRTAVKPHLAPGMNYRLAVPLDSGLTADPYRASALRPTVPFRLSVTIGGVSYLPIEMTGDFRRLGEPADQTQLDLTLGEDLDGDGLPDAWERALLAAGQSLTDVNPDGDTDRDGMSNLAEYLAGTYAFDAEDGFRLEMIEVRDGRPVLEFTAIRGRSYSIETSQDFEAWEGAIFRVDRGETESPLLDSYAAEDVRLIRVVLEPTEGEPIGRFFRLLVH